jgi:hypothetical protein
MERLSDCRLSLNGLAVYVIARCLIYKSFFQHQVDECLELAKGAAHREDAEFWEESARRWAELAQHKESVRRPDSRVDQH